MGRESLSEIQWGRIRLAIEGMGAEKFQEAISEKRLGKLLAHAVYPNQKHPRRLEHNVVDEAVRLWGHLATAKE